MAWATPKLTFVDQAGSICQSEQFSPLHRKEKIEIGLVYVDHSESIEIGLVYVDHSESVDAIDASFFEDHCVHNLLPSLQDMSVFYTEVDDLHNHSHEEFDSFIELFLFSSDVLCYCLDVLCAVVQERSPRSSICQGMYPDG
jgi:hypothetical protein